MRLGINVPNDLIQRVKEAQPNVNISQVCREALEQLAERGERVSHKLSDMDFSWRLKEFSESEKAPVVDPDWMGYALEDVEHWVNNISADDWADFCEDYENIKKEQGELNLWLWYWYVPDCMTFHHREMENEDWVRQQFRRGGDPTALQNASRIYTETWLAYVEAVRRKQLDIFEAQLQEVRAKRLAEFEARYAPEVPPHLQVL